MVHLSKIYTKSGDGGETSLGDGTRLPKHHLRVASYGTVDELSSVLGLAIAQGGLEADVAAFLQGIQNDLFDLGSDLCVPGEMGEKLRVPASYVERLERRIDELNEGLAALDSFILPGGTPAAAWLHLGRTVCRRAERLVSELCALPEEAGRVNMEVLRYLNRLSDLLFQMARHANDGGRADVLWRPGASAEPEA